MRFFIFQKYYRKVIPRIASSNYFRNTCILRIFWKNVFAFRGLNQCGIKECRTKERGKLHLIRKLQFRIFNSMVDIFSVIPPVIVYPVHLQFLIPYFSEFQNDFGAKSFNIKQVLNKK